MILFISWRRNGTNGNYSPTSKRPIGKWSYSTWTLCFRPGEGVLGWPWMWGKGNSNPLRRRCSCKDRFSYGRSTTWRSKGGRN